MTSFLFLQKFKNGSAIALPFTPVMDILSRFSTSGRGLGDLELTFPADAIAASCTVIGNQDSGISCIGFERPRYDAELRRLIWTLLETFACVVFNDTLDMVVTTLDGASALPAGLAAASLFGAREISSAQQLWPDALTIGVQGPPRPELRYTNRNPNGPDLQFFDVADFDENHVYIELDIRPEACNPDTLRVIRNLELRVDAAISDNPDYYPFYRFSDANVSLKFLESPRLAKLANHVTHISPPPAVLADPPVKSAFIADREVFANYQKLAVNLTGEIYQQHQLELDGSIASIKTLARLLDEQHDAYCRRKSQASEQADENETLIAWVIRAGAYLALVIRRQIGAQCGYANVCGQYLQRVTRTHRGKLFDPHLRVLDHIVNGPRYSVGDFFQALLKDGVSAAPRQDDLVCDIPGFCHAVYQCLIVLFRDGRLRYADIPNQQLAGCHSLHLGTDRTMDLGRRLVVCTGKKGLAPNTLSMTN